MGVRMTGVQTRALMDLIDIVNAARRRATSESDAESQLDSLFGTSKRLAVYGSLAPGRQNHHIVAPLGGTWIKGVVEGELVTYGWGAAIGYPALHLRVGAPAVPVRVLTSAALPAGWAELDAFEGAEYRRVLAPVWTPSPGERALIAVANVYEASQEPER
jgi:gamma-glutamylcyclotransferase (GGCT)/AIG2-like uncharacterized protein YtfP